MGNWGTLWQDWFLESARATWEMVTAQAAGKGQSFLLGSGDWGEMPLVLKGNFFSWIRGTCVWGREAFQKKNWGLDCVHLPPPH